MLIAQTGLNSIPLLDIQSGDGATSYSLWWLVPIALIVVVVSWIVRHLAKQTEQKNRPTRAPSTKMAVSKTRRGGEGEIVQASNSVAPVVMNAKKSGKSKKRDRRRSEPTTKSAVSFQQSMPTAVSNRAVELTPTAAAASTPSVSSSITPIDSASQPQQQTPVNAIFEPLRDVSQHRRRPKFASPTASSQSNDAVVSPQTSGGKFERTIAPSDATRLVSNRWPTPATQQVNTAGMAPVRPQSLLPPSPISHPVPVPVPATGLKSFVTRVKSSASTNTDPES